MESALFFLLINTFLLGCIVLLKLNKLIGLLATIYSSIWVVTIYLFAILSPASLPFITYKGVLVIYSHLLFVLGAACFAYNFYQGILQIKGIAIKSKYLYFGCLIFSGVGILMMLYTTDIWTFYVQNQLASLRGDLLEQKIVVNKYYKLMGNFIYPLAIIAPVYFFRSNKNILILVSVVVLGGLLSFSNGGKGNLLMVVILLSGAVIYMCYYEGYIFPKILKRSAILLLFILLGFFYFISATRTGENSVFSWYDSIVLINEYFSSSIPSLCQWLTINNINWINFNVGQFSLFRELGSMIGIENPRIIDQQLVNIPHPFNVFTAIADSLSAFGYVGSLCYYLLLGIILGLIDVMSKKGDSIFLFGTFFLFVGYSLFTDIFFYMIGSWICLSFYFLFSLDEK